MHITILGLGPSLDDYTQHVKCLGGRSAYCDEVWGINAVGNVMDVDAVFHMDDLRVQERRAEARPQSNIANMVKWMRTTDTPIVTCNADIPGFESLVEFPLDAVIGDLGECYFNGTTPYAIAHAIWGGATKISMFGCDYSYEHSHHAERGRACVEFWLGIAKQRGIEIALPQNTSLLDAYEGPQALFYGYADGNIMRLKLNDDNRLYTEREQKDLPSAEAVEHRYDHSRPTSKHIEEGKT